MCSVDFTNKALLAQVPKGDSRAVARLISLSENLVPRARTVIKELYKSAGKAQVIGITGSPGAGKSTLVDQLAKTLRSRGKKVAIIAVDPSSPFSGGAVLGDRIRMTHASELDGVFIRSMATRGSVGGLSRATFDTVQILDAAGFDIILIETVGVGQGEVDIMRAADSVVVVLVPGMGDGVQAFKAGILEIADVYAINKADRDGAELLERDLLTLLSLAENTPNGWSAPVVRTVATKGEGAEALVDKLVEHQTWLTTSPQGASRRLAILKHTILRIACDLVVGNAVEKSSTFLDTLVSKCSNRKVDPHTAAEELLKKI